MRFSVIRKWSFLALFVLVFSAGTSASERSIPQIAAINASEMESAHGPVDMLDQFGWLAEFYGPGRIGVVDAMLAMDGELVVATHEDGFGSQLARWDGHNWRGFGHTHPEQGAVPNGRVHAMASFQGDLVIAGTFTQIGDLASSRIARWNGETWSSLDPSGVDGFSGIIRALVVYQGELFAGGNFAEVNGIPADGLARWNGSEWLAVGGVSGPNPGVVNSGVFSMAVHQGDLYIGGRFTLAGGIPANNIARWHAGEWSSLPSSNTSLDQGLDQRVTAMSVWQGNLAIGIDSLFSLWLWDGKQIEELYQASPAEPLTTSLISHLTEIGGDLIGVGNFTPRPPSNTLTRVAAARWTGSTWVPISGDITKEPSSAGSHQPGTSAAWFDGQLVVGGQFREAGDQRVNRLSRWNGTSWGPLEATSLLCALRRRA